MYRIVFYLSVCSILIGISETSCAQEKVRYNYSQEHRDAEFGSSFFDMPLRSANMLGFDVNMYIPIRRHWFSGGGFVIATSTQSLHFGYPNIKPNLNMIDLYWVNEFRFIDKHFFKIDLSLLNVFSVVDLEDKYDLISVSSRYLNKYNKVAAFAAYFVQPGVNALFNVFRNGGVGLLVKVDYRFLVNEPIFGQKTDFDGFCFQLGFRGRIK